MTAYISAIIPVDSLAGDPRPAKLSVLSPHLKIFFCYFFARVSLISKGSNATIPIVVMIPIWMLIPKGVGGHIRPV